MRFVRRHEGLDFWRSLTMGIGGSRRTLIADSISVTFDKLHPKS